MTSDSAIVEIKIPSRNIDDDLEIPLEITVSDLMGALNKIYNLKIDLENTAMCFLKTEYPIALLKGGKQLHEFGVRNGTIINITE